MKICKEWSCTPQMLAELGIQPAIPSHFTIHVTDRRIWLEAEYPECYLRITEEQAKRLIDLGVSDGYGGASVEAANLEAELHPEAVSYFDPKGKS